MKSRDEKMKPKLKDLKYNDFVKLLKIIIKLSDDKEPFMITTRLEYFINNLNMAEKISLNMLVIKHIEKGFIEEEDFDNFILGCRNDIIEIDDQGKTPPEKIDFAELRLKTIQSMYSEKSRKKTPTNEDKQIIEAWSLSGLDEITLTKDYKEQEEFLINKYRSDLVSRDIFDEYRTKIYNLYGSDLTWRYVINYCKSKRVKTSFELFLKTVYEIIDCLTESDSDVVKNYIKTINEYNLDNKL